MITSEAVPRQVGVRLTWYESAAFRWFSGEGVIPPAHFRQGRPEVYGRSRGLRLIQFLAGLVDSGGDTDAYSRNAGRRKCRAGSHFI
jgi:hypothetical protein